MRARRNARSLARLLTRTQTRTQTRTHTDNNCIVAPLRSFCLLFEVEAHSDAVASGEVGAATADFGIDSGSAVGYAEDAECVAALKVQERAQVEQRLALLSHCIKASRKNGDAGKLNYRHGGINTTDGRTRAAKEVASDIHLREVTLGQGETPFPKSDGAVRLFQFESVVTAKAESAFAFQASHGSGTRDQHDTLFL